jgi:hypothetical protein
MKEEGFFLLKSPYSEHFERIFYVIDYLGECQVSLVFGQSDKIKGGKIFTFSLNHYKIVKKGKEYYLKDYVKTEEGKFIFQEMGPIPQKQAENFFIPLLGYRNQRLKKERLSHVLLQIFENQDEELTKVYHEYKKAYTKKVKAVKAQTFDKAAGFRDEERDLIEKIDLIVKNQICVKRGFKWVTNSHTWDILKELN